MPGVQHVATGPAERPAHAAQSQLHTAADLRGEKQKQMHISPSGGPSRARQQRGHTSRSVKCSRKTQGKNVFFFLLKKGFVVLWCCCTGAAVVVLRVEIGARRFGSGSEGEAPK